MVFKYERSILALARNARNRRSYWNYFPKLKGPITDYILRTETFHLDHDIMEIEHRLVYSPEQK